MSTALKKGQGDRPATLPEEQQNWPLAELAEHFATDFSIWNGETGRLLSRQPGEGPVDEYALGEPVRAVARLGEPSFVAEADGIVVLALPLGGEDGTPDVAAAPFAIRNIAPDESWTDAARLLNRSATDVASWVERHEVWDPDVLMRMAIAVQGKLAAEVRAVRLAAEMETFARPLAVAREEIRLLRTVARDLRISSTEEELGGLAAESLGNCLPAEGFAALYLPVGSSGQTAKGRKSTRVSISGACPVDGIEFTRLVSHIDLAPTDGPFIANRDATERTDWPFPEVRQLILVPLSEGQKLFGWLAAFNHVEGVDFTRVEAELLNSLGAFLGIHSSNRELYRQQSELVAGVVRALVSAIDAKDPYTSGHSDRVARFAVRIALEMKCSPKFVNTIYMAGLLHDVGKIGIDDNVLRKTGRLTDAEFEHVKLHPEMGRRILQDLKQLTDVLPAVLHHHEQWDGKGYPHGLERDEIPLMARIMAVADAFDAMTSDRPYREGMPPGKVFAIFRDGAGKHWDPAVLDAFFKAADDIREIADKERAQLAAAKQEQWV